MNTTSLNYEATTRKKQKITTAAWLQHYNHKPFQKLYQYLFKIFKLKVIIVCKTVNNEAVKSYWLVIEISCLVWSFIIPDKLCSSPV